MIDKILFNQIRKEVVANILGTTISIRLQGTAPLLFKRLYYDKIDNDKKRQIVIKVILDILSEKTVLPRKRLRCFAAYVASEIGVSDAQPLIEKMASDKKIQKTCLLLLLERALEQFKSLYEFSYEQMKSIIICQIKGKYQGVQGGSESLYDFKKYYYEATYAAQKRDMIKKVLLDILSTKATSYDDKRLVCYVAYIVSDIGLLEAKPIIANIATDNSLQTFRYYGKIKHALEKLDMLAHV